MSTVSLPEDGIILSVRALTERLRRTLEGRFPFVWVRGEVTNLSRPSSGHVYFSLKDAEAQLQCVCFRGRNRRGQSFDPLTGEVYESPPPSPAEILSNGLEVLCAGHIGVYAPRGVYQLYVELVQPAGAGGLAQAFEERKRLLAAKGYFALERKRPLPFDPQRVALITSPSGAAIHDFLELARQRGSGSSIRLFPVRVQGEGSAEDVIRALHAAAAQGWAEVIVLIRGGGSLEDLWTFNEEDVATAVFRSPVPVLAGIGHEVDVTLADMTADVRAATPSHAAQLLWPLRAELAQRVDDLETSLQHAALLAVERRARLLDDAARRLDWCAPDRRLERLGRQVDMAESRLHAAMRHRLDAAALRLERLEPRLHRAFEGEPAARESALHLLEVRLRGAISSLLDSRELRLERLDAALAGKDPAGPLRRGYALLRDARGRAIDSAAALKQGDAVAVQLHDGRVEAVVTGVHKEQPHETSR